MEKNQNPFKENYLEQSDKELVSSSFSGDKQALTTLIERHQPYIYNVAWKMVLAPDDAWDITQEVLIKVVTNLSKFRQESSFRTWVYRITVNHFLKTKQRKMEQAMTTFEALGEELDSIPNQELTETEQFELKEFVEDAKIGCMSGMLLCLSREQRLVFILGEIFEVNHSIASEILEISKDNFRQKLTRARKDMYNFMNQKCGLVKQNNPCRCSKKTKGFIAAGWVNAQNLQFNIEHRQKITNLSPQKDKKLQRTMHEEYAQLFQEHPFREDFDKESLIKGILDNQQIQEIFEL